VSAVRLWNILCSLKLAIVLASAAVLTLVAGSLYMPSRPGLFGAMDRMPLGEWYSQAASQHPEATWWVPVTGILMILLGINTLCCTLDWLFRLKSRWRKTGEYLLHLGFVLALASYVWGSFDGFRNEGMRIRPGQTVAIPSWPGHYLHLENVEIVRRAPNSPPDAASTMVLLQGDAEIARHQIRTNDPLLHGPLVVVPLAFSQGAAGIRGQIPGIGTVNLLPGTVLSLDGGAKLTVHNFYPWGLRRSDGSVFPRGENPVRPALELELKNPDHLSWRGWYFPQEGLPAELVEAGLRLRPVDLVYEPIGLFTVNSDPGAPLALAGGIAMTAGVFICLFSFYSKRNRGDRPEIS
jgi:fluoride ion exporter CrcB/FEX